MKYETDYSIRKQAIDEFLSKGIEMKLFRLDTYESIRLSCDYNLSILATHRVEYYSCRFIVYNPPDQQRALGMVKKVAYLADVFDDLDQATQDYFLFNLDMFW